MRRRVAGLACVVVIALAVTGTSAFELKPDTLAVFDRYVKLTEARMAAELSGASPFLWIDRQPEKDRPAMMERLRQGYVVVSQLETREAGKPIKITGGLLHHWIGTVLINYAPLPKTTAFIQDYDNYAKRLGEPLVKSQIQARTGSHFDVLMRTSVKKVITVVLDTESGIDYRTIGSKQLATTSVSKQIYEVADAGKATETRKKAEQGTGYLWRINTYCWFEERPEGTYEQCEAISLTRDAPFGTGWLIKPFITDLPRDTLEETLGAVRAALIGPS